MIKSAIVLVSFFCIGLFASFSNAQDAQLVISSLDQSNLEAVIAALNSLNITLVIGESFECTSEDYPCDPLASCVDTYYSYKCTCNSGYYDVSNGLLASANCSDVNECLQIEDKKEKLFVELNKYTGSNNNLSTSEIQQIANASGLVQYSSNISPVALENSHLWVLYNGVFINSTISELLTYLPCDVEASCSNSEGNYTCSCQTGFEGSGYGCSDIDECAGYNDCSPDSICKNNFGSYTCHCLTGFEGDGFTCTDVDECLNPSSCDTNANCANTIGSWTCSCKPGFSGDGSPGNCIDIDECLTKTDNCDENALCFNNEGSFNCLCDDGFEGNGTFCSDIDECLAEVCDSNAECTNSEGSYSCSCVSGYRGDGTPSNCSDINECAEGTDDCSPLATCINTNGNFSCDCYTGYAGDGKSCSNVNECLSSPCDTNANCNDTEGSFTCSCKIGFSGNGFECSDIDECIDESNLCSTNANCNNTEGSYTCSCKTGYLGDGFICSNIDECLSYPCDENADCFDTEGSYTCSCKVGFYGDGSKGDCFDIMECSIFAHLKANVSAKLNEWKQDLECEGSSECSITPTEISEFLTKLQNEFVKYNTVPLFNNSLVERYKDVIDVATLNDITPYLICDFDADCTNSEGSFSCTCQEGYSGDGTSCLDINECESDICDKNAVCLNQIGNFTCECKEGYQGTGYADNCSDIDECNDPAHPHRCDVNANCQNFVGNYSCSCKDGFSGDGYTCTDNNECSDSTLNTCAVNAECQNKDGTYCCVCNPGFIGDGKLCVESLERCNISGLPSCEGSSTNSCAYQSSNPEQAKEVFNYYRYHFQLPKSVEKAKCSIGSSLLYPLSSEVSSYTTMAPEVTTPGFSTSGTMRICDSITAVTYKTKAYTDIEMTEEIELFHFSSFFQWFEIRKCKDVRDGDSPIGCSQRYFPRNAVTIRKINNKFLVRQETVYMESGCEVDIFS